MLLLLFACAGGDDSSSTVTPSGCEPGPNPALHLGKGELSYSAMEADGGTIELVHGPQGGFHTVIALEAVEADASAEWTVQIRGYLADVERATTTPYVTMQCNNQTGTLQAWGFLLIWDAQPEELDGEQVHIEADGQDAAGAALSAAVDVVIEDPLI